MKTSSVFLRSQPQARFGARGNSAGWPLVFTGGEKRRPQEPAFLMETATVLPRSRRGQLMTGFDLLIGLALGSAMVAVCAWFAEWINNFAFGGDDHEGI